jgi:hypothetical protein
MTIYRRSINRPYSMGVIRIMLHIYNYYIAGVVAISTKDFEVVTYAISIMPIMSILPVQQHAANHQPTHIPLRSSSSQFYKKKIKIKQRADDI